MNQVEFFKNFDKNEWRNDAAHGVYPAGEGFVTTDFACKCSNNGLIKNLEVSFFERLFKMLQHILLLFMFLVEFVVENGVFPVKNAMDFSTGEGGSVHHDNGFLRGAVRNVDARLDLVA